MTAISTRPVACPICKLNRFWLRQDDKAHTLEVVCDSCGHTLTKMAVSQEQPAP